MLLFFFAPFVSFVVKRNTGQDGATILDYEGKLVAAGAIVNVDAGSEGGGRLAAARTLSGYGLAIKISSDGEIRGFKCGHSGPEEVFRVG